MTSSAYEKDIHTIEGMEPAVERTFIAIQRLHTNDEHYGHAARALGVILEDAALRETDPAYQRRLLKEQAQKIVAKFGPDIIPKLREDLQLALEENDL